ncbi:MAG TPA: hypothetical protein VNQ97_08565, partial [Burkholderiaceae bacterium]|nr:hypothetical protein [Burkholderiaceae bacterium]
AALAQRVRDTGLAPWQIQILSPTADAFHDFADPAIMQAGHPGHMQTEDAAAPSMPAINNNYQLEQHRRHTAAGWPTGRGPHSGQSIFEANTLVLRLRYLHEPALPGIKSLLRVLGNEHGTYGQRAMALGGYLPMTREIALTMDSHPLLWPLPAHGKFVMLRDQHAATVPRAASCQGWWCLRRMESTGSPSATAPAASRASAPPTSEAPAAGDPAYDSMPDATRPGDAAGNDPLPGSPQAGGKPGVADETHAVAPDDPACGAALCCVAG